jgi:AraC family L-rhamnose operon regulatory protein RhaS
VVAIEHPEDAMSQRNGSERAARPTVFRQPGARLYAGNCADLLAASGQGEVVLNAFARRDYPGKPLGEALPQVCSTGYWDSTRPQSWGLQEHCNEGIKIGVVARGSLDVTFGASKHRLSAGDILVVRPWELHSIGAPSVGPSRYIWLLLDVGVRRPHEQWVWPDWLGWTSGELSSFTRLLSQTQRPVFPGSRAVLDAFEKIAGLVEAPSLDDSETALRLALSVMLLEVKASIAASHAALDATLTSSYQTVRVFVDRLQQSFAEDWTLDAMASECGLSRTQFAKHFQKITNMTPASYLRQLRLDAALSSLATDPSRTITDIAFEHGFGSSQYFATRVLRARGVSPRDFKRGKVAAAPVPRAAGSLAGGH